ncbi:ABC transporter permease [Paenibacillus koleovorans]|uniref:ABC transporter permease n=1 Tax=Paenibacillus koleovorans TaxID=121608 RepID=UPI000FD9A077|nr:ABC-2 family transporter protein [Paenibacillus koleovorans]
MRLYFNYLLILLKSQLQYRLSFLLLTVGQFLSPFTVFAGLYFMFERFGQIKGWSFYEVALTFGVVTMAYAISECFARGFDYFSAMVASGDFDRLLVRPRSTVLQVLGSRFEFARVGRMTQGIVVLSWAISGLTVEWTVLKVATVLFMIVSGVFVFTGIFILAATLCFWTIQGLEITNTLTDGGREMSQYPLNIYRKGVARFFTFVIPFGCFNYLPLLYLLDRVEGPRSALYMLSPLAGIVFIVPCLLVWRLGVRHYRSTGS